MAGIAPGTIPASPRSAATVSSFLSLPSPSLNHEPQGSGSSFLCLFNLGVWHWRRGDLPALGCLPLAPLWCSSQGLGGWLWGVFSAPSDFSLSKRNGSRLRSKSSSSKSPWLAPHCHALPPENFCPSSPSCAHVECVSALPTDWERLERGPHCWGADSKVQRPQTELVLWTKELSLPFSGLSLCQPAEPCKIPFSKTQRSFPQPNPTWLNSPRTNLPLFGYLWEELSILLFFFWWGNSDSARNYT